MKRMPFLGGRRKEEGGCCAAVISLFEAIKASGTGRVRLAPDCWRTCQIVGGSREKLRSTNSDGTFTVVLL